MICAVIGILKQPLTPRAPGFEAALNEHLAPHVPRIVSAGYLRNSEGGPVGVMALLDCATVAQAETYLATSPFVTGGHFEHVHVAAYEPEVGRLG